MMEASKGRHLVTNVWPTLWTLQSWRSITNHLPISCSKNKLLLRRGIALDRWSHGISVMLENMFGCSLVTNLRSILLMELDFNFVNKTIYGGIMLDNIRKYNLMPEEIFSERNRMVYDRTLAKFYSMT